MYRIVPTLVAITLLADLPVFAATPDHAIVPGFERFYTGDKADAVRGGKLLLGELNCVSCHKTEETGLTRKQAPILDDISARVRPGYIKRFLTDPQAAKPGTTMPNVFASDPERDQKVEAISQFLATAGSSSGLRADTKLIVAGRDLYHKVGCVACHGSRSVSGNPETLAPASVPLGDLKAKYVLSGLVEFLSNPLHARPSGRMPKLLNGQEAKAVANYLLQGVPGNQTAGLGFTNYAYYEGEWDSLPDFSKLKPVATGTGPAFDLGLARRANDLAFRFEGYFQVNTEGDYTFSLHSDDGSRLYVDDKQVVDNDGTHAPQTAHGSVKLAAGVHKVAVEFFQGGGGMELEVGVKVPGRGRQDLADLVAVSEAALKVKPRPAANSDAVTIKPELVQKGKALFASSGCANCHELKDGKNPITPTLTAVPLRELKGDGGCLAKAPVPKAPHYALDGKQRQALSAALGDTSPASKDPAQIINDTLTKFNCFACHVRDNKGGPEPVVNKFFQTTQQEMGEEARLAPPLDRVGAKLNEDYLKHLLSEGVHDRPYMQTRMPGFGAENVGHLPEAFAAVDHLPAIPKVAFAEPTSKVKATARHLVSGQAFGCVKCHTFAGAKAEGVQGIDMTLMTRRLKRDWFHAYLVDPQLIRPGTRMPTAFFQGKSVLPDVLDGKPATQIEAMWVYLTDGDKARAPAGLSGHSIPLVPEKNAIIYRNFIEGSGPRAIGVGYPEKVSLTFDANEIRLSMLWQGNFIDAGRHWTDRGSGFEGPAGDNVLHLPAGPAFAILSRPDEAWPTGTPRALGYRFLGYRLTPDERPTFAYALGDIKFQDFPNPAMAGKEVNLRRTISITSEKPAEGLFFRAAVGGKIEDIGGGWYRIDGAWKLKIDVSGAPVIRESAGKKELLVPVSLKEGKSELALEYAW